MFSPNSVDWMKPLTLHTYLPQDRLRAISTDITLPDFTSGSALFADISGFTVLTEYLHETLGARQGAEELTKQLGKVYSVLITQIELFGGSVIDFAGDSMSCWFDDDLSLVGKVEIVSQPSAAHRAVACGLALQYAMQAFAEIVLPDNSMIALELKVAIASGLARRFIVGNPQIHVMDVVAGATIARTAAAEHLAQEGEVIVDEATVNILGDGITILEWRQDLDRADRFAVIAGLIQPLTTLGLKEVAQKDLAPEVLHPWLHPTLVEREVSGGGSLLTEFRPCVALFVRFLGIDYDTDGAGAQLDQFVRETQAIAVRRGGTFLQITIGDKGSYAYINFGVLEMHEDDPRRAILTALELRELAQSLGFLQPIQIGITQGTMRVGAYGGETRKTFGALGDDVNLAARLMTTAAADEILLSSSVYKAVMDDFICEPRLPLPMKGKAEPLPVFAVTRKSQKRAVRLQEPSYSLPMVGRTQELKIINDKLDLAAEGKSQVIGIVAEAGLGKSRLVAEVIRSARRKGFVGFGGACQSDGIHTPYLAWKSIWGAFFDMDPEMSERKLLRNIEDEIEDRAPSRMDAMPLLNVMLDLNIPENDFTKNLEPKIRQSALHALLEECLKAQATDEPTLIVIEDLHWIDALSHELLESLAKTLAKYAVCFVLAYRPPQLQRLQAPRLEALPQFTRIELHELTAAEAESVIRAKLLQLYPARGARGSVLPEGLVDALMRRAQGNPFYLEELLNYVRDRGLDLADLQRIELPDSLHTLILSRIDQLSENEKTTLRVASIVGRLFRANWLTGYYPELGSFSQVKVALDALDKLDITPLDSPEPELAYLFKHIVTHEVTYESLPFSTRARLHEQLAMYLESVNASVDAITFHFGRTENTEKKREYYKKASDAAFNVSALITAVEYSPRLLELTPDDDPARSALAYQLAYSHYLLGDYPATRKAIAQAQAAAQTETDRVSALALLGEMTGSTMGDYAEAKTILAQAVPLARASGNRLTLCRALNGMGDVNWRLGNLDEAQTELTESLMLARELGDVTHELIALNALGGVAAGQGNLDEAERLLQEVHSRAVAVGNREREMTALGNLGVVAADRKDYTIARSYFQQSIALCREISVEDRLANGLNNLACVNIQLGELSTAHADLREGLALVLRLGTLTFVVPSVATFAELAYAEGQTQRALALLGLARQHHAWSHEMQRNMDRTLAEWGLDSSVVEAGLAKGAALDWDETMKELLEDSG